MAAGLVQKLAPAFDLEVLRHGAVPVYEPASSTLFEGDLLTRNSSGLVVTSGANFSLTQYIAQVDGLNAAATSKTSAFPIYPWAIYEATLIQAFAQNLCLPSTYYGLTRTVMADGTTYAWCVDTGNASPHVEILGMSNLGNPGDLTIGDTLVRVFIRFNPAVLAQASTGLSSTTATVTAFSGGGQASATALTSTLNRVSTAAALGDSVRLPASAVGLAVTIDNRGANPIRVFGAGTETVNGIATATGVAQGINSIVTYYCAVVGNWEANYVGAQRDAYFTVTGDATINSHTQATYILTKGSAAAITLGAPTTGAPDDGIEITFISNSAFAHVITATGLLGTGSASVNVATMGAFPGASLRLMAIGAKWVTMYQNAITFS